MDKLRQGSGAMPLPATRDDHCISGPSGAAGHAPLQNLALGDALKR